MKKYCVIWKDDDNKENYVEFCKIKEAIKFAKQKWGYVLQETDDPIIPYRIIWQC